MAQVSVNITDHDETPIHKVYEEVLKDAEVVEGFISRFQFFLYQTCMLFDLAYS